MFRLLFVSTSTHHRLSKQVQGSNIHPEFKTSEHQRPPKASHVITSQQLTMMEASLLVVRVAVMRDVMRDVGVALVQGGVCAIVLGVADIVQPADGRLVVVLFSVGVPTLLLQLSEHNWNT